MVSVEDYIYYLRHLRKGFDRNEYEIMITRLGQIVEASGIEADEFHYFYKVWLNLNIPLPKWNQVGTLLVPAGRMEARTVMYTVRWLLTNYQQMGSISRTSFVLNWLTAAMDYNLIDTAALDSCYEVFYTIYLQERHGPSAVKLIYSLTKPEDVTRHRTIQLLDLLKIRSSGKAKSQVLVLLQLFKSYKPECVPENIPALSVHNVFPKINVKLEKRFQAAQERMNGRMDQEIKLQWHNPLTMEVRGSSSKPVAALIPDMEVMQIGSAQYAKNANTKNYLHFKDSLSLVEHNLSEGLARPARVRSLLCNDASAVLLACTAPYHAFLSHDLHHLLTNCFLVQDLTYKYVEKVDFLHRLGILQNILLQGIPVITNFLTKYLLLWNGREYLQEILCLVEWVCVDSFEELYENILKPLEVLCLSWKPIARCAVLASLANMYANMAFSSTIDNQHFSAGKTRRLIHPKVLFKLSKFISELCRKCVHSHPESLTTLLACSWSLEHVSRAELAHGGAWTLAPPSVMAAAILSPSALLLDKIAALMLIGRKIFKKIKKKGIERDYVEQIQLLDYYKADATNCLWSETAFSDRRTGIIFNMLSLSVIEKLAKIKGIDSVFSLGSHLSLAFYTYVRLEAGSDGYVSKEMWLNHAVKPDFVCLAKLVEFLKVTASDRNEI